MNLLERMTFFPLCEIFQKRTGHFVIMTYQNKEKSSPNQTSDEDTVGA
ncbi:MAG: hypothetical protein ACRES7_08825 [Gammaproteobacteria bacterium]